MSSNASQTRMQKRASGVESGRGMVKRLNDGMSHVLTIVPDFRMRLPTQAGGRIATHFRNTVTPIFTRGAVQRHNNNFNESQELPVSQFARHSELHPRISLPPPPSLPPTLSPPVSATMPADQHLSQFENRTLYNIKAIEKQYDILRNQREDLMGFRFRLQSVREDVRSLREQTGAQEGLAINRLKQHLHMQGMALPKDIKEDFDRIDTLRDKLGIREAEYEDAERAYHMQELTYNGRESELFDSMFSVDQLRPPVLGPSSPPMDENITTDLNSNSISSWQFINHESSGDDKRLSQQTLQPAMEADIHRVAPSNSLELELRSRSKEPQSLSRSREHMMEMWLRKVVSRLPLHQLHCQSSDLPEDPEEDLWGDQSPAKWSPIESVGMQFPLRTPRNTEGLNSELSSMALEVTSSNTPDTSVATSRPIVCRDPG